MKRLEALKNDDQAQNIVVSLAQHARGRRSFAEQFGGWGNHDDLHIRRSRGCFRALSTSP
jgi:hypothetical protein